MSTEGVDYETTRNQNRDLEFEREREREVSSYAAESIRNGGSHRWLTSSEVETDLKDADERQQRDESEYAHPSEVVAQPIYEFGDSGDEDEIEKQF